MCRPGLIRTKTAKEAFLAWGGILSLSSLFSICLARPVTGQAVTTSPPAAGQAVTTSRPAAGQAITTSPLATSSPIHIDTTSGIISGSVQEAMAKLAPASPFPNDAKVANPDGAMPDGAMPVPVQEVQPGTAHLVGGVSSFVHQKHDADLSHWEHQKLEQGVTLLMKAEDRVVDTRFGSVAVHGGSLVLILCDKRGLAVYNLHDTHNNAVRIIGAGPAMSLFPSEAVFVVKSSVKKFEDFNPAQSTAYRRLTCKNIGNNLNLFHAEYSIASFIGGLPSSEDCLPLKNRT